MPKKIPLSFSDLKMGCEEYGFIDREGRDPDDEDSHYQRYLKEKGVKARVVEGMIRLDEPAPGHPVGCGCPLCDEHMP